MNRTGLGGRTFRVALAVLFAVFFLFPLYAMADFSTRNLRGAGRTLAAWRNLARSMAPVQFLCLLLLTIPALVIVVGLRNVYLWVTYLLGESALTLTFVYAVVVLPFAYRAIDSALSSVELQILSEAARSLGAGWTTTVLKVVVPNIWSGIVSAAFISIAVVLGEYTIASLSGFDTLQVQIVAVGKTDGPTSVAASLAVLLFGFVLLFVLAMVTGRGRRNPVGPANSAATG